MEGNILDLVKKATEGDKDAYGEIYKVYLKNIYRFIYYMVYERELAEDLTQITFLKAWVSLHLYIPQKGTFQSYLFAIARNQVIDFKRRKKELSLEDVAEPASLVGIDEAVIQSENKELVGFLLGFLDSEERQLITLRYFEEFRFSQISRIMDQGEGTVRVKLHRILKKLRGKVKGENYGY